MVHNPADFDSPNYTNQINISNNKLKIVRKKLIAFKEFSFINYKPACNFLFYLFYSFQLNKIQLDY
jgi:hypothetical protein